MLILMKYHLPTKLGKSKDLSGFGTGVGEGGGVIVVELGDGGGVIVVVLGGGEGDVVVVLGLGVDVGLEVDEDVGVGVVEVVVVLGFDGVVVVVGDKVDVDVVEAGVVLLMTP